MIRIGISGWSYPSWRGRFYPAGLPHRRELEHASRRFATIEINATFYSLQRPDSFRRWYDETPPGFAFAVKGHRFLTHLKRLADVEVPLANFLASGVLSLAEKLGPILWQLPERLRFDPGRIERFLDLLPRDTGAAARIARTHEPERLRHGSWAWTDSARPLRHAIEARHPSFADPRFAELLRARGAMLVSSDAPGWPRFDEVTSDAAYARLHGAERLYASGYSDEALDGWADRIRRWTDGGRRDAWVYFDNDALGHAPFDALGLARRLGGAP